MRISAFTIGSDGIASSRLRSYYLFHDSRAHKLEIVRREGWHDVLESDVLHIQKLFRLKLFILSILFRIRGKTVVFDFDDQQGLYQSILLLANILISNIVTTDTEPRKDYWRRIVPFKKIVVIPDILDVHPEAAFPAVTCGAEGWRKEIVWIGNDGNIPSIIPLIRLLRGRAGLVMTLITYEKSVAATGKEFPWINVVKWERDILLRERYRCTFMVLNHAGDSVSYMKSDNKMVLAIAAGVIPIVSRTAAYSVLAKELDAEILIFDEFEDVFSIIAALNEDWIMSFLERGRRHIRAKYGADVVLNKFLRDVLGSNDGRRAS